MRYAICYVSSVDENLQLKQTEELLDFCLRKNETLGIKGILLYSEGKFFQIIEGEKGTVLNLFEKIRSDTRHHGIIQVIGRDIERGSFDGYKVDVIKEELQYEQEVEVPKEYIEALYGIPPKVKEPMERMLTMFIATR